MLSNSLDPGYHHFPARVCLWTPPIRTSVGNLVGHVSHNTHHPAKQNEGPESDIQDYFTSICPISACLRACAEHRSPSDLSILLRLLRIPYSHEFGWLHYRHLAAEPSLSTVRSILCGKLSGTGDRPDHRWLYRTVPFVAVDVLDRAYNRRGRLL